MPRWVRLRASAASELVLLSLGAAILFVGLSPFYRTVKSTSQARKCFAARERLAEAQLVFYKRSSEARFARSLEELKPYTAAPCGSGGTTAIRLAAIGEKDGRGRRLEAGDLVLRCSEEGHAPCLLMHGHPDPKSALTP